jgi:chromosome segregation ATPase
MDMPAETTHEQSQARAEACRQELMTKLGELTLNVQGIDDLHAQLTRIERKVDAMAADQAALDQAVNDLVAHTDAIDSAVQALIDKLAASGVTADFQAEVDALQAATNNLQTATDQANTALNPPAA